MTVFGGRCGACGDGVKLETVAHGGSRVGERSGKAGDDAPVVDHIHGQHEADAEEEYTAPAARTDEGE